jgi:Protein of unknown function (DUF3800)
MLNAYVDASGKGDPHRLVVAGYIASPEAWMEFSREWQSRLAQARLQYFKMHEMAARPEIAGWFYRTVEEHNIKAAISCVINTTDLVEVFGRIKWPPYIINLESFSNPYYFAFKAIIDVLAQQHETIGLKEQVNFVFDNEAEKKNTLKYWEPIKMNSAPEFAKWMGNAPVYRDDRTTPPLQAADLYAWWILKWERQGLEDWARDLPFPWGIKRDIRRLAMSFSERDFLIEHSKGLAKYARSQVDLEYASRCCPLA